MTERFTETISTGIVTDNVTGKEYKCEMRIDDELLELLNALHEENTRLKEIISANRTITIPYTITDEKLVKELKEMFKEDLE